MSDAAGADPDVESASAPSTTGPSDTEADAGSTAAGEAETDPTTSVDGGVGRPSASTLAVWLVTLAVVGVVALGVGLLFAPETVRSVVPVSRLRPLLGSEPRSVWRTGQTLGVVALGVGALGLVVVRLLGGGGRLPTTAERAITRVQGVSSTAVGAGIDEAVDRLRSAAGEGGLDDQADAARRELRTRLRSAATTVLTRQGLTLAEAEAALAEGSWTTDPRAAAFFGSTPSLRVRVRDWLSTTPVTTRRAGHALETLERTLDADRPADDEDASTAEDRRHAAADGPSATATLRPATAREGAGDQSADRPTATDANTAPPAGPSPSPEGVDDGGESVTLTPVAGGGQRHGLGAVAGVVSLGVAVVTATPAVALLGVVGLAYAAAGALTGTPTAALSVTRTVGTDRPVPGDVVEVEVTVENVGDGVLPAVTTVDGVPDALSVVEGSPSTFTALRPGETDSYKYAVRARRGRFAFEQTDVALHGLAGTDGVGESVSLETPVECLTLLDEFPLESTAARRVGAVRSDTGGEGIEFHAVREYRQGDPTNRIDWNRLARTGELTTVEFRQRRSSTVLVVVDARDGSRVAPTESALDAVDRSVYGAERVFLRLLDRGVNVGVASWDGHRLTEVSPSTEDGQRPRALTTLRAVSEHYSTVSAVDVGTGRSVRAGPDDLGDTLRRRLPTGAQVVLFSPVLDDRPVELARRLQASGRAVTVVSPAAVGNDTVGQRTLRLERACLLDAVRETGAGVVDWAPDEAVQTAVTRLERRLDR